MQHMCMLELKLLVTGSDPGHKPDVSAPACNINQWLKCKATTLAEELQHMSRSAALTDDAVSLPFLSLFPGLRRVLQLQRSRLVHIALRQRTCRQKRV